MRVFDQNLEIHVTNHTNHAVYVPSCFDLKDASGRHRIETLVPLESRIGSENSAHEALSAFLDKVRIEAGAMGVGIAQGALDLAAVSRNTRWHGFGEMSG